MAKIQFKNLAASTLIEDVATNGTQIKIVVADADKFPEISAEQYFIVAVINSAGEFEIMRVTGANNGVFTVMRSQEGTAAKAFQIGDRVEHRLTAESLVSIVEEASVTKYHTSEDPEQYGHATSTLYSHVKITDDPTSSASALLGIGISPYAVKTRFDQLAGATTQQAITASGNYTVPETGNYELICVGGGGTGGTGGYAGSGSYQDTNTNMWTWYLYSGGGGGGGGAGQVITKNIALTKGTVIPVVIGAAGGATSFGTHATALAGVNGNNGGNASCVHTSPYDCGTSGNPGGGGTGGYSYGSAAGNGGSGTGGNYSYATYYGGAGGNGGVSAEGTYGNGGKGSAGGWVNNPQAGDAKQFHAPVAGTVGTQGCVKIRMVLGT